MSTACSFPHCLLVPAWTDGIAKGHQLCPQAVGSKDTCLARAKAWMFVERPMQKALSRAELPATKREAEGKHGFEVRLKRDCGVCGVISPFAFMPRKFNTPESIFQSRWKNVSYNFRKYIGELSAASNSKSHAAFIRRHKQPAHMQISTLKSLFILSSGSVLELPGRWHSGR